MSGEQRKFELSMPQIMGSALAAVTAAVAASYLGVAGTVIGAAVVSIASTVATAVYTHYLKRTGERVKQHTLASRGADDSGHIGPGESTLVMPSVRTLRWRLPWVRLGAAAALVFGVSMGSILVYQAVAQETLHEQVTGKAPTKAHHERHDPAPSDRGSQDQGPAYVPQTTTRQPFTPTPTPTPTPSRTPSESPTPDPTPTTSDSVEPSDEPADTPTPDQPSRPDQQDWQDHHQDWSGDPDRPGTGDEGSTASPPPAEQDDSGEPPRG